MLFNRFISEKCAFKFYILIESKPPDVSVLKEKKWRAAGAGQSLHISLIQHGHIFWFHSDLSWQSWVPFYLPWIARRNSHKVIRLREQNSISKHLIICPCLWKLVEWTEEGLLCIPDYVLIYLENYNSNKKNSSYHYF